MNTGTHRLEAARKFIRDHWELLTDMDMSKALGMNIVSIRRLRYRMGLIRKNNNI